MDSSRSRFKIECAPRKKAIWFLVQRGTFNFGLYNQETNVSMLCKLLCIIIYYSRAVQSYEI